MKRIGFVVEGPSDKAFLEPVLYRHFHNCVFDIRVQHSRSKLIPNALRMLRNLRATSSQVVFFLVDQDKEPCISMIRDVFDAELSREFRAPSNERRALLCVARREIEAWFLADEEAIREVTGTQYSAPAETGSAGTKRRLGELFEEAHNPLLALNEIEIAKVIGGKFSPARAREHSASFNYFWSWVERITSAL